mgnify:FL=1
MQIEQLTKLLLNDDEVAAMYEVCAVALEKNLLEGYPLAFALAIVETLAESDDIDTSEGVEQITIN